jgi:hypothetical protein
MNPEFYTRAQRVLAELKGAVFELIVHSPEGISNAESVGRWESMALTAAQQATSETGGDSGEISNFGFYIMLKKLPALKLQRNHN